MRWGIVGFGWVAQDFMTHGIAAAGGSVLAVLDGEPRARQAAMHLGIRVFDDLKTFLGEQIDAVYVATPNDQHRSVVEACLVAGVPVLCEKPLASTIEDAVAMADTARKTGTLLGVAFDQRRHPAHAAIRDAIADGVIGSPTAVRIVYACWLDRNWSSNAAPHDNWRIDARRAGGGATIDLAPHGLDLAAMLLGEPVVSLAGFLQRRVQNYDVDDGGMLTGRTETGALVSLHVAYNVPERLPRRRLEVCGTRGQIIGTDTMGQDAGGSIIIVDASDGRTRPLAFDAATSPFTAQARAFANAVRGGPHDYDVDRDVAALRLLLAVTPVVPYDAPQHPVRRSFESQTI